MVALLLSFSVDLFLFLVFGVQFVDQFFLVGLPLIVVVICSTLDVFLWYFLLLSLILLLILVLGGLPIQSH